MTLAAVYLALIATLPAATAAPATPVNVPYPLSPEEAARDFLRAVDDSSPRPWVQGVGGGQGLFLTRGILHGKTRAPDGASIFMIRLPSDEIVLVRCEDSLPELALGQQLYLLVDFASPEGAVVARLRGVVLACDLGPKAATLDTMLGLKSQTSAEETSSAQQGTSAQGQAPNSAQPTQGAAATTARTARGQGSQLPQQPRQPAAQPGVDPNSRTCVAPLVPAGGNPAAGTAGAPWPPTVLGPGGTASAQGPAPTPESPQERQRVEFWKDWIAQYNSKLTDAQREAIVRWTLYYSSLFGVDHRLIFAVMKCESNFDPGCRSHAGALGLMQLMPETCRSLDVDPWVVEENIRGGIQELAGYLDKYAGRSNFEQCALALACYNAGPGRVQRAGGIPNIEETKNYVRRVTQLFNDLVKQGAP
ncbi:MAG: transglycosylase SLT domain-containing protein [Armatimonadetes bacterium]|nr:transglycosylase SLT domain-containing protein [Armatimonadota bacterium]